MLVTRTAQARNSGTSGRSDGGKSFRFGLESGISSESVGNWTEPYAVLSLPGGTCRPGRDEKLIPIPHAESVIVRCDQYRVTPRDGEHYVLEALRLLFWLERVIVSAGTPRGAILHRHVPLRGWVAAATGMPEARYTPDRACHELGWPNDGVRLDFSIARPLARAWLVPWCERGSIDLTWQQLRTVTMAGAKRWAA